MLLELNIFDSLFLNRMLLESDKTLTSNQLVHSNIAESINKEFFIVYYDSRIKILLSIAFITVILYMYYNLYSKLKVYRKQLRSKDLELRILERKLKSFDLFTLPEDQSDSFLLNHHHLNDRQRQIVSLLLQGYTNSEIGEKLFITPNTVKYHIKNIYKAFQVKNRNELFVKFGFLSGFESQLHYKINFETMR